MRDDDPGTTANVITPATISDYRAGCRVARTSSTPRVGRGTPSGVRNPTTRASRPSSLVQPAVAPAPRFRGAHRRRRRRRACATCPPCSVSSPAIPARSCHRTRIRDCPGGSSAALPQPVLHDLHHPLRHPDPGRPPAALLDPSLHAGQRMVPFQESVPADPLWTAKQDSVTLPGQVGLPGLRHSIGLARWWHLGVDVLWLANGLVFYVLLFSTGQWRRIVPTTWQVFPSACRR